MSINHAQLRAFHAVASHGTFTQAARALHVTQPTLSDHVRGLESRYGIRLFERRGKTVRLTGLGEALLDITRRQFALEAEAENLLSAAQGMLGGTLRVAADSPFLIMPALGAFQHRYPNARLSLRFGNAEQVLDEVLRQRSDLAVLPNFTPDSRLHARLLHRDRLALLVPLDHAWARRRTLPLSALNDTRVIVREPGSQTRAVFEQALAKHGIRPRELLEIGSREAVREAVVAGLGVGIIAESEIGGDPRLHTLRLSGGGLRITESLVWLASADRQPTIKAFLEFVSELK